MSDTGEDPYPLWDEPATKGDVLTAMIWGQTLHVSNYLLAFAVQSGDKARIADAQKKFDEAYQAYDGKINEIAGKLKA